LSEAETVHSPIATGGAGEHFEQHVDAFALALLLVGATPPILTNTSVVEVCLQTKHLGWRTDDLLIVGETGLGARRKLAAQVKRRFTVSAADVDCRETFKGFWDDFLAADRFEPSEDRLAVITLQGTSTLLGAFGSLLVCARATADAADFGRRMALDGYLPKKAKLQNKAIQAILADHIGSPPEEEAYWRFLRTVNVLSFDLNTPTAQTEASILSLLAHVAPDAPDPVGAAKATWVTLLESVSGGRPSAATYRREDLPAEILDRHSPIPNADSLGLRALVEHGRTVRDSIRSTIGSGHEIDRLDELASVLGGLVEHQVVVITGAAGSGKSAIAKKLLSQVEPDCPVLAFQAVEFATAHINETLANSQVALNSQRLQAILAGHDRIVVLVESIERLLEHPTRDAFAHLLQIALHNRSIHLVLTCRDYSVETVRNALLAPLGLLHFVHEVPALTDEQLRLIREAEPNLQVPLQNRQLRSFLATPYLLDLASQLDWEGESYPNTARSFREKCWRELIRAESFSAASMPRRREEAFHRTSSFRPPRLT